MSTMRTLPTALAALLLALVIPGAATAQERIVGGTPATADYPWMASLQERDSHICGATLVRPQWVLTAGHCVEGAKPEDRSVLLGVKDLDDAGKRHDVAELHLHPLYDPATLRHDVALVKLREPSALPAITLVAPGQEALWAPGAEGTVIGWGEHQSPMDPGSYLDGDTTVLREVKVPFVSDQTCANSYDENKAFLTGGTFDAGTMVCAGDALGGRDSCFGDSGGPIFVPGPSGGVVQVGTVSWGYECAYPTFYGIYSRLGVSALHDWIKTMIGAAPAAGTPVAAPVDAPAAAGSGSGSGASSAGSPQQPSSGSSGSAAPAPSSKPKAKRSAKAYAACVKKAKRRKGAARRKALAKCKRLKPLRRR